MMYTRCKLLFTTLTIATLLISGCGRDITTQSVLSLRLHDYLGNEIALSDYQGKWIVLNFWASWCQPCRAEIPTLNSFYQEHREQALVVGVGLDPADAANASKLQQDFKVSYPLVFEDVASTLGIDISYMPTTVFINPQGKIVKTEVREQTMASLAATTRL